MWSWWVVLSNTNEKTAQNKNKVRPVGRTLPKTTDDNDMYSREFPNGNFLFFFAGEMSLFRLPRGKLPLPFLAVPAGKDGCSHRQVRTMSRVWGGTAFAKRSGAMKAPVGLLSGSAVCDSRWRGVAPTSATPTRSLRKLARV